MAVKIRADRRQVFHAAGRRRYWIVQKLQCHTDMKPGPFSRRPVFNDVSVSSRSPTNTAQASIDRLFSVDQATWLPNFIVITLIHPAAIDSTLVRYDLNVRYTIGIARMRGLLAHHHNNLW